MQKEVPEQVITKTEEVLEIINISIETTKEEILISDLERVEISEKTYEEDDDDVPIFIPKFDAVIEDFTLKKEFEDAFSLDDAENIIRSKACPAKTGITS
ncbi:MAG: hypothetical protein U5K51_00445 [Flavobacteriaceae bacterium]|nr:hypothetical protein [Flavobacteriaceae bacterium]